MIRSITIRNHLDNSIKLELTRPDLSGFIIKSIDGLGPTKANINTTDIATNDGSIFNSSRLDKRNITLDLEFFQTDTESIEDIRQKTYKYFPVKQRVCITVETDNHTLETEGYIESNEPNIFSKNEGTNISIICPDPFFYSKNIVETVFSGVEPLFEFPFSNESLTTSLLEFGAIQNKTEQVIVYEGDGEVGISIHIHALGSATSVTIANVRTREVMVLNTEKLAALTGSGIIAGDDITINTQKGNKNITLLRDGVKTNILNCIERNSDWFTLVKGDNVFTYYTTDSSSSNLQFYITNKVAYDGV